jgi:hypothetical protein
VIKIKPFLYFFLSFVDIITPACIIAWEIDLLDYSVDQKCVAKKNIEVVILSV